MKMQAVMDFIKDNFYVDEITITDFPLFPFGKKITDVNGDEMVVYFDYLTDSVKWVFPDGE